MFPDRIGFFTADLSFISILKVLPAVYDVFKNIRGVILVKPQFEAESSQHKKGVVRNQEDHVEILKRVAAGIVETGFNILKITYSPIKGPAGNIEFLFYVSRGILPSDRNNGNNHMESEISAIVETAHNALQ
jgi:23S rRNA (cytidine1920-2'-O)/16S rRNA (cytidine1409-2'-O)-methyltransferase